MFGINHRNPMKIKNKLFFFLSVFLCIATGIVAYIFFVQKEGIKNEYIQAKQSFVAQKDELNKKLSSMGNKIKIFSKEKEDLQTEIENLQAETKKNFRHIKQKENEYKNIEKKYKSVIAKQDLLTKQLKKTIGEKIILKKEIEDLRSEPFLSKILEEKARLILVQEKWKEEKAKIKEIKKANEEFAEKDKLVRALSKKILAQKKENFSLNKQLDEIKQKLKVVQKNKQKLSAQIIGMLKSFRKNLKKISKVRSAEELSEELRKVELSLASKLEGIELPVVIVRTDKPFIADKSFSPIKIIKPIKEKTPRLAGEILKINKKYNFVVINLGKENGLREKEILDVYQDRQNIGKIKVTELRAQISAADIIDFKKGVKVGDKVIKK